MAAAAAETQPDSNCSKARSSACKVALVPMTRVNQATMLHLRKLAAVGPLDFFKRVERQDPGAQHASGREISLSVRVCGQSPVQSQYLNLNSQLQVPGLAESRSSLEALRDMATRLKRAPRDSATRTTRTRP